MDKLVYNRDTKRILAIGRPHWSNEGSFKNHNIVELDKIIIPEEARGYNILDICKYDGNTKTIYVDAALKASVDKARQVNEIITAQIVKLGTDDAIRDGKLDNAGIPIVIKGV